MTHKDRALALIVCIAFLLGCLVGLLLTEHVWNEGPKVEETPYANLERLTGAELRGMMNEDKWSPGQGDAYAQMHPDFAWLFDDSFVHYIYD